MDKKIIESLMGEKKRAEIGLYIISTLAVVLLIVAFIANYQDLKSLLFGIIGSLVGGVFAYFIAIISIVTTENLAKAKEAPNKINKLRIILVKLDVVLVQLNIFVRSPLACKINKRSGKSIANTLIELSDSIRGVGIEVNEEVDRKIIEFLDRSIRNKYFHFISIPTSSEGEDELLTEEEFSYLFELHTNLTILIENLQEILQQYEKEYKN